MALGFHMGGGTSKPEVTEVKAGYIAYSPYQWTAVEGTYNLKTNTFTPIQTKTSVWNGSGVTVYDIANGYYSGSAVRGYMNTLKQVYAGTSWTNATLKGANTTVQITGDMSLSMTTWYFYENPDA